MRVLITAGPTQEALDPVRYFTNHSSGKMGYALADAFAHAQHQVLLISGPTSLAIPSGVDFASVVSAADMYDAVESHIASYDVAIFAAAVADYAPKIIQNQKIKKQDEHFVIEMQRTKDILGSARSVFKFKGTLIGFAAETESLISFARKKRLEKQCDLIIANDVSRKDIGFNSNHNEVTLVYADHEESLDLMEKSDLAECLMHLIIELHHEQKALQQT